MFSEGDADPIIRRHAIHWLVCIESYATTRPRRPLIGARWSLFFNAAETCAYRLLGTDRVVVAFRGTKVAKDLYDDRLIALGQVYPRAEEAVALVRSMQVVNPSVRVEVCGHSLGGSIATMVSGVLQLQVVTFNAAAPPSFPVTHQRGVHYHIVYDIISAWQGPFTVRIDKGFRPVPLFWQKLSVYTWLYASLSDLIESHKLANFSNARTGKVICGEAETVLIRGWLNSLPSSLKLMVYASILGVTACAGFPDMHGCYGG